MRLRPSSAPRNRPTSEKKVTFRSRRIRYISTESEESSSTVTVRDDRTHSSSEDNAAEDERDTIESKEHTTNVQGSADEDEPDTPRSIDEELISRAQHMQVKPVHRYMKERKLRKKKQKQYLDEIKASEYEPEAQPHSAKFGVVEDAAGVKHSDCNLKSTDNKKIKQWLSEKNKLLRAQKKQKRKELKKEKEEEEQKEAEKAKRQEISQKKLREWSIAKRKEAKLLKREKQEAINLTMSSSNVKHKEATQISAPKPATIRRPKSAPVPQQATPRPSEISTQILIDNNPDLKEKLRELERQKKLKHRQSYEDWCKVKAREKRDTLKAIREQRIKLEKEISEESARLISEAARRRTDGMK